MLTSHFFQGENVLETTKNVLGKKLCTHFEGKLTSGIIVEAEAYRGLDDLACHAYPNKRSPKWNTMYLEGGHAYVYICYGIHSLFNIVTGPRDKAEVVLIRAIQPLDGIEYMKNRRGIDNERMLTNGPGKLTQALGIEKQHDGEVLFGSRPKIWLEEGWREKEFIWEKGPRVGLSTAKHCMNWPWRFKIKGNKFTSKPNKVYYPGYPA